jgi:ribosomal protein S12 methylthiotransferase accessory factor YcaO
MAEHQGSRVAVQDTTGTSGHIVTTEIYEAAFRTTGDHPQCGVAIARTLHEARQRLADMLIFCDPRSTVIADIVAFHRDETVDHYEGSTGDIFARVNAGAPGRTVTAQPLTGTNAVTGSASVVGER